MMYRKPACPIPHMHALDVSVIYATNRQLQVLQRLRQHELNVDSRFDLQDTTLTQANVRLLWQFAGPPVSSISSCELSESGLTHCHLRSKWILDVAGRCGRSHASALQLIMQQSGWLSQHILHMNLEAVARLMQLAARYAVYKQIF